MVQFDNLGANLYSHDSLISVIMYSRDRPDVFRQAIQSLENTCTNKNIVEIIIKLDYDDPQIGVYLEIIGAIEIQHKTVISPRLNGYWSIHTYLNDLSMMASGKILWILGDDIFVHSGDWVSLLSGTRDVFQDNIYVVHLPGPHKKEKMISPVLSREWIDALGFVSPHPAADRFLSMLASHCNRLVSNESINGMKFGHNRHSQIKRLEIDKSPAFIRSNIVYHVLRLLPILQAKIQIAAEEAARTPPKLVAEIIAEINAKHAPPPSGAPIGTKFGPGYTALVVPMGTKTGPGYTE